MVGRYQTEFETYLDKCVDKLKWVSERNRNGIPYYVLEDGKYNNMDNAYTKSTTGDVSWWTNGFFAGMLWQLYNYTREEKYREWARIQEVKLDRCFDIFQGLNHDVGFMWLHTSVANYQMTQDPKAKVRAVHAANILAGRFNLKGNFIRAWGGIDNHCTGLAIIDCLMNLSLLYWATEETGDPRFEQIARAHADMALDQFIREDGSVHHIVKFDAATGEVIEAERGQGYEVGSSWTRGQAWGIYGFVNSFLHTKDERYLDASKEIADYFIKHLPDSHLAPIDFQQPAEDDFEDNSATCIAICGLLDLGKALNKEKTDGNKYFEVAEEMLKALCENRLCLDSTSEALVERCAVAYHFDKHITTLIYADYFLLEALLKVNNQELKMW